MNRRYVVSCGLACAVLALTGCDQGREAPGKVAVRVANVAPGFQELAFRREQDQRNIATMTFKNAQEFAWDADTYDFFVFERTLDPNGTARSWTFSPQLEEGTFYSFVLTEVAGAVEPVVLSYPAAPAADAQIVALHAASGLPAMDLYLERPGVGIAGATPRGTFAPQQSIAPRTLPSGDYELWLTAAGDPASVLLATSTLAFPAGETATIVVVPESGHGTEPLSVLLLQASPSVVYDRNATAELRVINGATDQAPRDFAVDNQFSPPLFSAIPFGEATAFAPVPLGARPIAVTPVGNPGVLELNQDFAGVGGVRTTMLFAGPAGTLTAAFTAEDSRRIHNEAKVRFMNAASQFASVDFVLTAPGGNPDEIASLASLGAPAFAPYFPLFPGEYDLYVRQSGAATLLSGPTRITVAGGGLYGALAVNGADTATVNVVLLDDFP